MRLTDRYGIFQINRFLSLILFLSVYLSLLLSFFLPLSLFFPSSSLSSASQVATYEKDFAAEHQQLEQLQSDNENLRRLVEVTRSESKRLHEKVINRNSTRSSLPQSGKQKPTFQPFPFLSLGTNGFSVWEIGHGWLVHSVRKTPLMSLLKYLTMFLVIIIMCAPHQEERRESERTVKKTKKEKDTETQRVCVVD